jgi:hypothetical protein
MSNKLCKDNYLTVVIKILERIRETRRHNIQRNDNQLNYIEHKELICDTQYNSTSAIVPSVIMLNVAF